MEGLKETYGAKQGENIYIQMRHDQSPEYLKGMRTAREEGHTTNYKVKFVK
jgi:hypothetical protein